MADTDETIINSGAMTTEPIADAPPGGETSLMLGDERPSAAERLREQLRSSTDKLRGEAGNRARGLMSQGIERSSGLLGNVSQLVGDTAPSLDERLGAEYGDYARRAAEAIDRAATALAEKNADELIDDAREFVRNSPGVAVAGAAILGFALVRLVKAGLDSGKSPPAKRRPSSGKGRARKA